MRVEYDGTDFVGSQWQNNGRSVQGALEAAWEQLTGERSRFALAGRTDAGVHARGQVANIVSRTALAPSTIVRALNAHLPEDVGVSAVWEAPERFHARHSAVRREYRYVIDNGRAASVLLRRNAAHITRPVDVAAMHVAGQELVGTHDFAAFMSGPPEGSTVRTCLALAVHEQLLWEQPLVVIDIAANAFLRQMVRNIVGLLLLVGEGRADAQRVASALASHDRRQVGQPAPAHGLCLMAVHYPEAVWPEYSGADAGEQRSS